MLPHSGRCQFDRIPFDLVKGQALLPEHRVPMRTTNGLERLNKEIKRRTRVSYPVPQFSELLEYWSVPSWPNKMRTG